jgi:hypothetical protein
MEPQAWLQMGLTIVSMVVAMLVFYFKSEQVLRKEILASEERLRTGIDSIKTDVGKLSTRVAVIEAIDEQNAMAGRGRLPSAPGRY